jgi:dipeptidyl aminopeptidase/acylaminoacyl peptidase
MKLKLFGYVFIIIICFSSCQHKMRSCEAFNLMGKLTDKEIITGKLTPEILWKFGRVSDAQLSDDGKYILYCIKRYNLENNKSNSEIFIISSDGGQPLNLTCTEESEINPRWSPERGKIGYLSPKSGTVQIWEMNIDGSGKKQISYVKDDINSFEYAPDGKHLFYTLRVKTDTSANDIYPDLPMVSARIITDLMYRHWDKWSDYSHSHIFVADYRNDRVGESKDIMAGEPYDSPLEPFFEPIEITWSPDGKTIAYTCKKLKGKAYTISTNSDIYLYSLETGKTTNLTTGMEGYDRFPVFSPDGKKIAWQSMATPGYESDKDRLFICDLQNGKKTDITANFDQSVSNIVWSDNSQLVYFISGIQATYQVCKANILTSEISQVTKGWHDYSSIKSSKDVLIGERESMSSSSEVYRINEKTGEEKQLTFTNQNIYDKIRLGKVEERWISTTDQKKMLVWLVFPPDFDSTKTYPALLYCQGGPQVTVSQFFSYRWNLQLIAAGGYIVIAPNRRGLPTFGSAWNDQIAGDYGGQNMKDYLSAVDAVKNEPYIDSDNIGAVGPSYGGYSIFYLAGIHQKRFKAFVAHCGLFNLESEYASTEEIFFPNHDLGGPFWQTPRPKSYDFSPHLKVQNWDTPIMIITCANDFRVPYTESLQAFDAAQLKGIPSKLLFFPDEGHWVLKPQNSVLWYREFFAWLDKWLRPKM